MATISSKLISARAVLVVLIAISFAGSTGGRQNEKSRAGNVRSSGITKVECRTTASKDPFVIDVHHEWSPQGAKRFVDLVEDGFYKDICIFRSIKDFIAQFGISSNPEMKKKWE
jgi:hypothetical protein